MMISDDYPLDFGVLSQTNPYRLLDSPASPGLQFVSASSCNMPLAAAKISNWFRWEILPNSTMNIHHHNCFPRTLRGTTDVEICRISCQIIAVASDGQHAGSFPRLSLRSRTLRHVARLSMTITLGSRS